ncbi:hypothetical protein V8F20_006949 [Naviculisporaceae sp. PSN 640]
MTEPQSSETTPLLSNETASQSPEPQPPSSAPTEANRRFDRRAKGVWSFCTEGTRIYFTILIASCLIAIADLLFKASLTALYKDILCCQRNKAKCHNSQLCYGENAKTSERELSEVFQLQSFVNAAGGFVSISLWYWIIWPYLQKHQPINQKDMTQPLLLSLAGFIVLMTVNISVAYATWQEAISVATFKNLVIWEQLVSFLIGGGPPTYWAYREIIVAAVITPPEGLRQQVAINEAIGDTRKPFKLKNRQTGYVLLQVSAGLSQLLGGLVLKSIPNYSQSTMIRFMCLLLGLVSIASAYAFLWTLPSIPLPSPTSTGPTNPSSDGGCGTQSESTSRGLKRISIRDGLTVALVLLSGIARGPLYSSIASNFAVFYISRRMDFNTNDAVLLISLANIFPPLIPVLAPEVVAPSPNFYRPSTSSVSTTTSASRKSSTSSTYSTISVPPPQSSLVDRHNETQAQQETQDWEGTQDQRIPVNSSGDFFHVKPSQITNPLAFLATGILGASMMAFSTSLPLTHTYWFVFTAILCISIGAQYPLFTEPILAGWSAEGKKPVVFVIQQLINAVFLSLGAWLLNHGFQREAGDGDGNGDGHSGRGIGWTYMGIMIVSVAAAGFLICAAWVSKCR